MYKSKLSLLMMLWLSGVECSLERKDRQPSEKQV